MPVAARTSLVVGILFLCLTILNTLIAEQIDPSLLRAEVLSAISSVCLMLVAFLWTEATPRKFNNQIVLDEQGLYIDEAISDEIRNELGWGSYQFLTATAAATILIYWDERILLQRGVIGKGEFKPGKTCMDVQNKKKLLSLGNTKLFPARIEFDTIVEDLPSIIIYPLEKRGWVILGGCSEKCFTKSDERWVVGWSNRLESILKGNL